MVSRSCLAENNGSYRSPRFAATWWSWVNGSCWEINASENSDGNVFDESPLRRGIHGSLFDSASSETLGAPETVDFFVSDAEGDPDCPTQGYSSIELALQALCQGKVCSWTFLRSFLTFFSYNISYFLFLSL